MKTNCNINELRQFAYVYGVLVKRSHSLNNLYTADANGALTQRQAKRMKQLQKNADGLANSIGLKAYHQTDCRGASIYLIDDTMNNSNYTNGICVW